MKRTIHPSTRRGATIACLAVMLVLAAAAAQGQDAPKGKWIPLFNGKNLDGWTVKIRGSECGVNDRDTFRVEDGLLKVRYDKYDKFAGEFGHIFTRDKYSNYRLRVEYRFVGEQVPGGANWAWLNSGVMIHSQPPESMKKDQEFPDSIEVQLLGNDDKTTRTTANLCTPGTNVVMDGKLHKPHCTSAKSDVYRGDEWVTVELEVRSTGTIRHIIDGKTVLEYEQAQYDEKHPEAGKLIGEGYIALQSESHPVDFRKVELLPMDK